MALAALFLVLRALFLTADPPLLLPNGASAHELFVEPAAKAHEARNWALFHAWRTSPVDNYQFWRAQSPVWVYPLAGFFRVFGVGYAELRVYAALATLLGLAFVLALAARKLHGAAFCAVGVFLAADFVAILYDRSGIIEPALNAWLAATVLCLHLSRRNVLWLVPAQWAFALAILTKQTALFLLPLVLVSGVASLARAARAGERRRLYRALVLGHAVALLGALALYASRDEYLRTVFWNYGHAVHGEDGHTDIEADRVAEIGLFGRLFVLRKFERLFTLLPIAGALALGELARIGVRLARRRHVDAWSKIVALWWLSAFGMLLLVELTYLRYYVVLFPPAALLAGGAIQQILRLRPLRASPARRRAAAALLLGSFAAVNGLFYARWASARTYDIVETNRKVEQLIGDRPAVVVGLWAGPLVLETPYVHYYVKQTFNRSPEALVALGVTHILLRYDADGALLGLLRRFPGVPERLTPVATLELRGRPVQLIPIDPPLALPGAEPAPKRPHILSPKRLLGPDVVDPAAP